MKYLSLLLLVSCALGGLKINGEAKRNVKIIQHEKYQEVQGTQNVLRSTSGATLMVKMKQTGDQDGPQDLMGFSVGSGDAYLSRASIRVEKDGYLKGIARAGDSEEAQNLISKKPILTQKSYNIALVVDYSRNIMKLFVDGYPVEASGDVHFTQKLTSDTPSQRVAIGSEDDGSNFFFQGTISEPKVWGRALTDDEVMRATRD